MIYVALGVKAPVIGTLKRMGPGVTRMMAATIREAQAMVVKTAKEKYLSGPRPQRLGAVTKRLRGSITGPPARKTGNVWIAQVGSRVHYASIHELGGRIKPKHGEYLAIPLSKRFRGVPLRQVPNTFIRPMKNDPERFIVFQKYDVERVRRPSMGKGRVVRSAGVGYTVEKITPIAILQKSVRIPKRPFLGPAFRDNRNKIELLFAKNIRELAREAERRAG